MGLIYKPNALYMTPKNESVDVTDNITLSFIFKGYQMEKAIGQLYQNSNIGEWTTLGDRFDFSESNKIYYNNENVVYITNSGDVYNLIRNNVNSTLGWGVTVYGRESSQQAVTDNKMVPTLKGFETGDTVMTYEGSGTATPYEYTFINNYTSKLTLGNINSGTDIEGTDLTNTFTISEAVYINLTSGDCIQENISSTKYYLYKINEGASDPVGYYIRFYATEEEAIAGTGTIIDGNLLKNKTYYVNPTTATTNQFYVGVLGGNVIQLYTTKESSLQGVSEAVVPLTTGNTYTIQVVENSQIVQFIPLLKNEIEFDLSQIYSGDRAVILTPAVGFQNEYTWVSSQTLYTGQQLTDEDGKIYYLYIWNHQVGTDVVTTLTLYKNRYAALNHNETYLVTAGNTNMWLSEVLDMNKDFTIKWKDMTNIPLISSWEARLYNVEVNNDNEVINKTLIEESGIQYNANVQYTFLHLLLSCLSNLSGVYNDGLGRYLVQFDVVDNTGYQYIGELLFDVGYPTSEVSYSPLVNINNCDSSITTNWQNALSIQGKSSGDITYINDYLYLENKGAQIGAGDTLRFETEIPAASIPTFLFQPSVNFNGVIFSLDGDEQSAILSYNNTYNIFTLSVTNKDTGEVVNSTVATSVTELLSNHVYLIGYASNAIYIRDYKEV